MYNDVIFLIKKENVVDEYGDIQSVESERMVFAEVKSIGQNEFYQAQANGFRPEIKFILSDFLEYKDEPIIRYTPYGANESEYYSVIRTYRNDYQLELTCRKGID